MTSLPRYYIERGWTIVPAPLRTKHPGIDEWHKIALDSWDYGTKRNVCVHLGPSGLVDIDLDSPEAIELASQFLPETVKFGRQSKRASHFIYRAKSVEYRKFVDPLAKNKKEGCILEIRSGDGLQTVFPPSIHETGERIEWEGDPDAIAKCDPSDAAARLAVAAWKLRYPGVELHPRVRAWLSPKAQTRAEAKAEQSEDAPLVVYADKDPELIALIVEHCPAKGSRHDYRLAVAGALWRAGFSLEAAEETLVEAMSDPALGKDRKKAIEDARAAVRDTFESDRDKAGAGTLIETFEAQPIVSRIEELITPTFTKLSWVDRLFEICVGSNLEVFEKEKLLARLAKMQLKKDSRLPPIWAKLRDSGFLYLRELREAVEFRAKEIVREIPDSKPEKASHEDADGFELPPGYTVQDGRLLHGEELVMNGELEILAKCPSPEGMQCRVAFRSPSASEWRHTVIPYRCLVDSSKVLTLAEHGANISSLEATAIVGYCRDFVARNEAKLDRPIAIQTGWHSSGAFAWGRTLLFAPEDLSVEYPADNQIGLGFVSALRKGGKRSRSFAALARAVVLPTCGVVVAASLAAAWGDRLRRPCLGVHLASHGGQGKTRTLKIAGSVWGETGSPGALAARGVIAGANTTARALEVAAAARNHLPLLISDLRPFAGLAEVYHAILNGDPRARATRTGGSTQGDAYACGAVISEGELNVLSLTTRQGFHRRMLELGPDHDRDLLWNLGAECSEHFGHFGPAFLKLGPPDQTRFGYWSDALAPRLGHDAATNAATLLGIAEHAAQLLDVDPREWCRGILSSFVADSGRRREEGATQADRAEEDLSEILVSLAPQIAEDQSVTRDVERSKPWVGYRTNDAIVVQTSTIRNALMERGHHAIRDTVERLIEKRIIRKTAQTMISGIRVRCYWVQADE